MFYRILLVDDHTDTLMVLSRLLKRAGHQVFCAETAAAARRAAEETTLDILLIDLGLPDLDGRDLLRSLRGSCTAPAIALTGFGGEHDIESCLSAGFARHLVKPVTFEALMAAVDAAWATVHPAPVDSSHPALPTHRH
jgi:two-component system CheB/CheR fusion protein